MGYLAHLFYFCLKYLYFINNCFTFARSFILVLCSWMYDQYDTYFTNLIKQTIMEALRKFKVLFICLLALGMFGCDDENQGIGGSGSGSDSEEVLVKKVVLDHETLTLKEGAKPFQLTATVTPNDATNKKLKWTSEDEDVAVVDNGLVTAVAEGTVAIVARTMDGSKKKDTCMVTVVPLAPGEVLVDTIILSESQFNIKLDEESSSSYSLTAVVSPYEATNKSLEWVSTNEDVVYISYADGWNGEYYVQFSPVGAGTAFVKALATDGSGVVAVCEVTVTTSEPEPDPEPDDVKNKLAAVGVEFVNAIEAETHKNVVDVITYLDDAYGSYDIDDAYESKLEGLLDETSGTRAKNPVKAMANLTKICLAAAQNGAQLSSRVAEVWTYTLHAGLTDLYGKFIPDSYYEEWAYDSSVKDRLEVAFPDSRGQQWVATLKGSKETSRVHVVVKDDYSYSYTENGTVINNKNYIDNYNVTIDVPKQMTFAVKCEGSTIVDMTINSDVAFETNVEVESESKDYYNYDEYYGSWYDHEYNQELLAFEIDYKNLNVDAKMTVNGYEETFKTNVTKSGVTANAGVKIDGKSMLTADAKINADFNAFFDAVSQMSEPTPEEVANWLKDVSVNVDVMGQVQLKASCPSFYNLYKASEQVNESYDFNSFSSAVESYNKAFDIKLYFDKKSSEVAFIEIEAYEEYDEWDGTTYYDAYPVIVLTSDDSRHNIEDYFDDEASFTNLIDAVEDLAEEFEDFYGGYFEEDDYYPY